MTDERLEAIRERLEAATDGPWSVDKVQNAGTVVRSDKYSTIVATVHPLAGSGYRADDRENANLVAHAPTDLRYLLDRIEAQAEVVEAARDLSSDMQDAYDWGHEVAQPSLDQNLARLREALDNLEEQTDAD